MVHTVCGYLLSALLPEGTNGNHEDPQKRDHEVTCQLCVKIGILIFVDQRTVKEGVTFQLQLYDPKDHYY
jgi:hypothetical protein